MTEQKEKPVKKPATRKILLFLVGLILYLVTSVPVGLFLYSVKTEMGINVFSDTGFHSYMNCLHEEAYKAAIRKKNEQRAQKAE